MMKQTETYLPLRNASINVAAELDALEHRMERLEQALDVALGAVRADFSSSFMSTLQEVDVVRQTIAALSAYLMSISEATDETGSVDLSVPLSEMPLRDVAARLCGSQTNSFTSGEPELF